MSATNPIRIIGGGLAGLVLGIGLRQRGVPVDVYEAGGYPRHRVCGEFICGMGLEVLREFGLYALFSAAGGREARTASFHSSRRSYRAKSLHPPALCLSRFVMDEVLSREFRALGGDLKDHERVSTERLGPGWVRASGRRIESADSSRVRWVGLKAHALGVSLGADLEMHFVTDGYVGLCRLDEGRVNVCGLFAWRGPVPELSTRWQDVLCGPANSILRQRLRTADFDRKSFRAVAGLGFGKIPPATDECRIGDALVLIPPVTGNGMSMAFETARAAVEPLAAYGRGELNWERGLAEVASRCRAIGVRRSRWARWLQRLLMHGGSRPVLLALSEHCDFLWRVCLARTR